MPTRDNPTDEEPAPAGARTPRHLFSKTFDDDERYTGPYHENVEDFRADRRGVGDDVGDPGLVEPFGDLDADRDNFHLDEHVYVCASCGYQTADASNIQACPNCAAQDEFVIQP